jgi:hypothetical protein
MDLSLFKGAKDADARPEARKGTRCSLRGAIDTAAVLRGFLEIRAASVMLLALSALASTANATEVMTTSYSAWLATTSGAIVDSNGLPGLSTSGNYGTQNGYSLPLGSFGPISITGPDKTSYTLIGGYYNSSPALLGPADGVGTMTLTPPAAGLTAFMLQIGISDSTAPITITLSDGESFVVNPALNSSILVGFSSATPITQILLSTNNGSQVALTDFLGAVTNEPGTTADTPSAEVATAFLIGGGLLLIGARRKVFSNLTNASA